MTTHRVRARTAVDHPLLRSWVSSPQELYLLAGPSLTWPLTTEQFAAMDAAPSLTGWMVHSGASDDPWGHFDLAASPGSARLGRVIINPLRRGTGLGQVLIRLAISQARHLNCTRLTLNVIRDNAPAIRTYLRAGFTETPTSAQPDYVAMTLELTH